MYDGMYVFSSPHLHSIISDLTLSWVNVGLTWSHLDPDCLLIDQPRAPKSSDTWGSERGPPVQMKE